MTEIKKQKQQGGGETMNRKEVKAMERDKKRMLARILDIFISLEPDKRKQILNSHFVGMLGYDYKSNDDMQKFMSFLRDWLKQKYSYASKRGYFLYVKNKAIIWRIDNEAVRVIVNYFDNVDERDFYWDSRDKILEIVVNLTFIRRKYILKYEKIKIIDLKEYFNFPNDYTGYKYLIWGRKYITFLTNQEFEIITTLLEQLQREL